MALISNWRAAATRLGVEISEPDAVPLSDGSSVRPMLHVPFFGGPKGTLVFANSDEDWATLTSDGYYCSVFRLESVYWAREATDDDLKEVLADWGWTGAPAARPAWL